MPLRLPFPWAAIAMSHFATDLKKMFNATMFDRLEAYWVLPNGKSFERTDEDESAIGIFEVLPATVDAIPSSLIDAAEELRAPLSRRGSKASCRAVWHQSAMVFRRPARRNFSRC
jgi:hypothetical protein